MSGKRCRRFDSAGVSWGNPKVNTRSGRGRWLYAAGARSLRTTLAVLAVLIMPVGASHAQFLFWNQFGSSWDNHPQSGQGHRHRHRHAKPELTREDQAQITTSGPLQIVISIADQRISVYDNDVMVASSAVSTGIPRHPTPLGVFSIISKQRWHQSNIYSAAPMPFMQRITWSGIALHAGVVPGHPASHGCIRLKTDFAVKLWHLAKRGTRVIIAPGDTRPVEIASPSLFVPKPRSASAPTGAQTAPADNVIIAAAAAQPRLTAQADTQRIAEPQSPQTTGAPVVSHKLARITVFISRKLGRLFVRQGFTPLFDIPVTIQHPQDPLGTHIFTVKGPENEGAAARWMVVSVPEKPPLTDEAPKRRTSGKQIVETAPVVSSPDMARAAIERIEVPQDVKERISELLTPGSSLIVSDYGISLETGADTDFIVVMQ